MNFQRQNSNVVRYFIYRKFSFNTKFKLLRQLSKHLVYITLVVNTLVHNLVMFITQLLVPHSRWSVFMFHTEISIKIAPFYSKFSIVVYCHLHYSRKSFIYYVRKIFRKTNISYPLILRVRIKGVKNVSFRNILRT